MTIIQAALKMSNAKRVTYHVRINPIDSYKNAYVIHVIAVRCKNGWTIIKGSSRNGEPNIRVKSRSYSEGMDEILTSLICYSLIGADADWAFDTDYVKFE